MKLNRVRFTTVIDADILKAMKHEAIESGSNVATLIEKTWLSTHKSTKKESKDEIKTP